ncbi:MAG: hypothetical protein HQL37_05345 [Alphaproteobacteria bacterium]|nr:hypothetical protein [Alphaproteobacteria bacterium]
MEANYRLLGLVGVRASINYFKFGDDVTASGINYTGNARLLSGGLTGDFFPLANMLPFIGGFRVSGGVRVNDNQISIKSTPTQSVTISGKTYTAAQAGSMTGVTHFNLFAPYVGIGYDGGLGPFEIGLDVGAMYQGTPNISLWSSSAAITQSSLNAQANTLNHNYGSLMEFYPVVGLTARYKF